MVKFNEIPKEVGRFTREQLDARERRLSDPALQAELERTKNLLKGDIKSACTHGLEALYRFTLAAPLSSLWEGTKEAGSIMARNMSVKNPKNKRSYSDVPATMITEFLSQYAKGVLSTAKLVGNLSLALGRGTVLGGRYTIGK